MKVGIALKPKTPASAVFPFGDSVDLILVMTVEPGFGGQSFMEDMMPKVAEIRAKYPGKDIEVKSSNLKPWPRSLKPSTLSQQSSTLNPQPSTLNPQPSTLNPQL